MVGEQGGCVIWGIAVVYAALADACVYLDGATHLFLPSVTHSSATRQRSEMLRDRPSPVVPFTVPNRESVSGTNRYLSFFQHQCWQCRGRNPCERKGHGETPGQNLDVGGWGDAMFPFPPQTQPFFHPHLVKRSGKVKYDL